MKNLLVAQSGGPTAAINATLAGVISNAMISDQVDRVIGSVNGIQGVFNENFLDLKEHIRGTKDIALLMQTPAAALGSCRFKLGTIEDNPEQFAEIIRIFKKNNIGYFVYIGGNDSMDTVDKLSSYCMSQGIDDIKIVGAPKTIDNDLMETDHCPGFGSAAKYIGTTFAELERDCNVYDTKAVTIVEVMGRNAGWLTAASVLARENGGIGPGLIYLCEKAFDPEQFVKDVKEKLKERPALLIAVSEGIKDKAGNYISEVVQNGVIDNFGHSYISGAVRVLEDLINERIGCKVRSVELNLMQRCGGHIASDTDLQESRLLGMKACQCALDGETGVMAALKRTNNAPYEIEFGSVLVSQVANKEKKIPLAWINEAGNDVTEEMITYLRPLIVGEVNVIYENGIPVHKHLYDCKYL